MTKKLNQQLNQTVAALSKSTPTKPGEKAYSEPATQPEAVMNAIDRIFIEFEMVYHNQYCKAFPTPEKLNYGKKVWFDYLRDYQPEFILAAARKTIRESEFLPSVASLLNQRSDAPILIGLPDAYSAYVEACNAPHPKAAHRWSHPAVYHAGRACDWYFLATHTEKQGLPVFTRHYLALCEQLAKGRSIELPADKRLEKPGEKPLSPAANREQLRRLRREAEL